MSRRPSAHPRREQIRTGSSRALRIGVFAGISLAALGIAALLLAPLLSLQSSLWIGLVSLILYNLVFILPLAGLLFLASARPVLLRLARWNRQHPMTVRFFIGLLAVSMGLLVLAMI